jgi:hypothetical protein
MRISYEIKQNFNQIIVIKFIRIIYIYIYVYIYIMKIMKFII